MNCARCGGETPDPQEPCPQCSWSEAFTADRMPLPDAPTAPVQTSIAPTAFAPGASFGARYTIIERIGSGGMGEVYKALDRELEHTVALKLIRQQKDEREVAHSRFRRELSLAQKVTHPNVCRVHDLGDVDGTVYISMEHVEGQTLDDLVRSMGHLSPHQVVSLGKQICAGIAAIHERGIVHRDLKPSNIMINRQGRAIVMDFGIAYHPGIEKITAVGAVVGTMAYLSPEQARGQRVDARSDVYAIGLILFEMLTGRRPPGDNVTLPLALRDQAERCPEPSALAPDISPGLDDVVMKCLARKVDQRYASALAVAEALQAVGRDIGTISGPMHLLVAAPITALRTASRRRPWSLAVVVAAICLAFGYGLSGLLRRPSAATAPPSIALLPFAYEGPSETEYLRHLIPLVTSENLRSSSSLIVTPYATSRTFAAQEDARSVATQLGVSHLAQGEIQVQGAQADVRMRVFANGREAWSTSAKSDLQNTAGVADELSRSIANALRAARTAADGLIAKRSDSALQAYLEGKTYLEGWDVAQSYQRAESAFTRAIQSDNRFAEAYAGLARSLWLHYLTTRDADLVQRALDAAQRAIDLDPALPEAYLAQGLVRSGRGQTTEAIESFNRVQQIAPADDFACRFIAGVYNNMGRYADAEAMFRRAIELRPAFWQNQSALGTFFLRRGRLDDAKLIFRKVIELNPQKTNAYINLASVHMMAGEWSSAEPLLLAAIKMDSSASAHNNLGVVYFSMARFEDAAREFRAAIDSGYAFAEPYGNMGDAYRFLGQQQKAKAAYGRAVELWDVRLKLNDKDVEGRIGLSKHLACLGLCTKARKQSQRALELASEQPMVQYNAAISYAICGDRNAAIRHLARALTGGITSDVYTNPDLATILRDPSIQALLARIPNRRTAPNSTDR